MRDKNHIKFIWDIFIIIAALYNCFFIPYMIAFNPPFSGTLLEDTIDVTIDILFAIDITLTFRTTYIE